MSIESKIEWTDMTWNFIAGCDKVSKGCSNCYAIKEAYRLSHNPNEKVSSAYKGTVKINDRKEMNWTGQVNLLPHRLEIPFTIKKGKKIFVNSMSDLFHEDVPFDLIDRFLAVAALTPHHTYQVLTKRPSRMMKYFHSENLYRRVLQAASEFRYKRPYLGDVPISNPFTSPLDNLWLGVSAEDQQAFDTRITPLMQTPASIRFVSFEPLLGSIDFTSDPYDDHFTKIKIDWAIIGGESGYKARPMQEDWARSLKDQCQQAGVDFFYKQKMENKKKISLPLLDGIQYAQMPGQSLLVGTER